MEVQLQPSQAGVKRKKKSVLVKVGLAACALALAGLLAFQPTGNVEDNISERERSQIVENMRTMSPIPVTPIAEKDVADALATMPLDKEGEAKLKESLRNSSSKGSAKATPDQPTLMLADEATQLVSIDFWDFASQDGDVVSVSSAGYTVTVNLMKAPSSVAIPIDASRQVVLTGLVDGGGGITLGVSTGHPTQVVIAPGINFQLPVSF